MLTVGIDVPVPVELTSLFDKIIKMEYETTKVLSSDILG